MPNLATYYIENHKIEVNKSLLQKERVYVNGKRVSELSSEGNGTHHFTVDGNRYQISRREASQADKMNTFKVLKNGAPIALVNIESENPTKMLLLVVLVGVGCGFLIGAILYNML